MIRTAAPVPSAARMSTSRSRAEFRSRTPRSVKVLGSRGIGPESGATRIDEVIVNQQHGHLRALQPGDGGRDAVRGPVVLAELLAPLLGHLHAVAGGNPRPPLQM